MSEILTIGGEYFNFEDPSRSKFSIKDIAHALSHICRFNGHCKYLYSVAQHSVLVSYLVDDKYALQGLLHDAHEAFVGDMTTMLKRLIPEYKIYEDIAAAEVRSRFGIPFELHESIHEADMIALMSERRNLLPERKDDDLYWPQGYDTIAAKIFPESPGMAYAQFMKRYEELTT